MNLEKLNAERLEQVVYEQESPCLIIFYRKECHVCKEVVPVLEELEPKYQSKCGFYSVDVEEEKKLFNRFSLKSIPQILFFYNGEYHGKLAGLIEPDTVEEKIAEIYGAPEEEDAEAKRNDYDLVIIGGGPAGLSAAIYGGRAKLRTLVINKGAVGGLVNTTREIVNWPGNISATGPGLMEEFRKHAEAFGVEFLKDEAIRVDFSKEEKIVQTKKEREISAKAVILACGSEPRLLNIPGERRLRGEGVAYCATCDAESFEGQDVVVVGSGDQAIEEGTYITRFARNVTVVVLHDEGVLDCNKISAEKAFCQKGMCFVWNSTIQEIKGKDTVESVVVKNIKTGETSELACQGVFMFVGMVPSTKYLEGSGLEVDKMGYIPTNERMETNIEGVYAVGDNRTKYLRQVVTAAGDGATAAVAAERYIMELNDFRMNVLAYNKKLLLLFFDPKDNASLEFTTLLELANKRNGNGYKIVKIDVSMKKMLAGKYGVKTVPAVLAMDKGNVKMEIECTPDKERLAQRLSCWN